MHGLRLWLILATAALATLAGCGGDGTPTGLGGDGGGGTAADVVIDIKAGASQLGANAYSPNPDTVQVGQTVAWRNLDAMVHTATATGGKFNTGNIAGGKTSAPIAMTAPAGSFSYFCAIPGHNMTGTLVVIP